MPALERHIAKTDSMKTRTSPRLKISPTSGIPPATLRKLEEIGRDIAGLRTELAKLTAARGHEHPRKPRNASSSRSS